MDREDLLDICIALWTAGSIPEGALPLEIYVKDFHVEVYEQLSKERVRDAFCRDYGLEIEQGELECKAEE